jgi:hypothetical protein
MAGELIQQIQPVTASPNGAPSPPASSTTQATPTGDDAAKRAEAAATARLEGRTAPARDSASSETARGTRLQIVVGNKGVEQVKVLDSATDKVVLEVPPEELVEFAKRMDQYVGLLFNKVA